MIPKEILKHAEQNFGNKVAKRKYLDAWRNPRSLRKAITAKCIECVGFEDYIKRIKECDVEICPFHRLRHVTK